MIKKILVLLDTSEYSKAAVDYACALAKQHKASLTGIVVLNLVGVQKTLGRPGVGGIHYQKKLEDFKIKEAQEHITMLKERFSAKCKAEKVSFTIEDEKGSPTFCILEDGKFHDLIVLGMKTHLRLGSKKPTNSSTENIVENCITPKYLVPAIKGLRQETNKVLILLDDSQPSGRALQRYTQVALPKVTDVVKVVMSGGKKKHAMKSLERAGDLLTAHGFKKVELEYIPNKLKAALSVRLVKWADLIVLSPNQEKEIIHFKFSNFTKFLIKMEKKPIFLG